MRFKEIKVEKFVSKLGGAYRNELQKDEHETNVKLKSPEQCD